jgi:hypothetical protein
MVYCLDHGLEESSFDPQQQIFLFKDVYSVDSVGILSSGVNLAS